MTVCIAFRINNIASGDGNYLYLNSIIDNNNGNKAKYITFYKTHSGLGLAILTAYYSGSRVAVANNGSTFIDPDYKFTSSKSSCTILNKWHVISVTWSNRRNLSNCWSNGEKLMTFNTSNAKGYDHCIIVDIGTTYVKSHLIGCIEEIIGFYRSLTDTETSNTIHFGCVIGDHHISSTIHLFALGFNFSCGVTSCHSCGVMSSRSYIFITAIPPNASFTFQSLPQLWRDIMTHILCPDLPKFVRHQSTGQLMHQIYSVTYSYINTQHEWFVIVERH